MDVVEATGELQDWELLQSNSDSNLTSIGSLDSNISDHEIDSGGVLNANYFSLDDCYRSADGFDRDNSAISDNSSSINFGLEENPTGYPNKVSSEFLEETDLAGINEMGCAESDLKEVISEVVEGRVEPLGNLGKFCSESFGNGEASGETSECSENSQLDFAGESEVIGVEKNEDQESAGGGKIVDATGNKRTGELEKRSIVWWKVPMQFLKYYGFRMSPLWTVSVAAAAIGIAILSNKLYKVKKKKTTRGLGIKVAIDDKKVSQVMNRVSRLNEAFSVVKGFPMVRPLMPAVSTTTSWPVMNFR